MYTWFITISVLPYQHHQQYNTKADVCLECGVTPHSIEHHSLQLSKQSDTTHRPMGPHSHSHRLPQPEQHWR